VRRHSPGNAEDRAKVLKALEILKAGDDFRVTVLRDDNVVELTSKFPGF
jgi:hypothetical protein